MVLPSDLICLILSYVPTRYLEKWHTTGLLRSLCPDTRKIWTAKLIQLGIDHSVIRQHYLTPMSTLTNKIDQIAFQLYIKIGTLHGDLSYSSHRYLPLSTCINGAYMFRDLCLLQHFVDLTSDKKFTFTTTDLTWSEGLTTILGHFDRKIYLPPITSVRLSPDSISILKESMLPVFDKYDKNDFNSYTGYFNVVDKTSTPPWSDQNFDAYRLGWLRGIKDTNSNIDPISDDVLLQNRLHDLYDPKYYAMMVSLDLPAVDSSSYQVPPVVNDRVWIQACLAHARYDQLISIDHDLITSIFESGGITVYSPDHLTKKVIERYQKTAEFIRTHIRPSNTREAYLTLLGLYTDRETPNPHLLHSRLNEQVLYSLMRCANFKQLQQLHQLSIPRELYMNFNGYLSDVLRDPVQTLLLVKPDRSNMLHQYNFTLWQQGRLFEVTEELKRIACAQPDIREYIYKTLLHDGWGQTT